MDISTVAGCLRSIWIRKTSSVTRASPTVASPPCHPAPKNRSCLARKPWNEATIREATKTLRTEFTPISDVRGSADFRQELIANLLEKFFQQRAAGILPAETNLKLELPWGAGSTLRPRERP